MTVPARNDAPDVLGSEPARTGRRPVGPVLLGLAVVAVAAAALLVPPGGSDSPARVTPVEVTGSMTFDDFLSRGVDLPFGDEQERNAVGRGSVQLLLPEEQLLGDARIDFGASWQEPDDEHAVFHAWGRVFMRFGRNACRGSFGWSNFVEPLEGGGSMHLRCEDGAVILADLAATPQPTEDLVVDLHEGWYIAGD